MAILKDVRHLGCVFQDTEPPESLSILRKGPKSLGTNATSTIHKSYAALCRPSHGEVQVKVLHQRSPYAMKFEDGSQEEIERQERCALGDAWRLAKNILKLKIRTKASFFSPTNEWCLPAPSVTKTEERKFVVDFRSIHAHVEQEKPELCRIGTVRVSESPTTAVAANGEVQTKEEATVCVKELDSIRDSRDSRRYTGRSLTRITLRRSRIFLVDQWPETHQRWQRDKVQHEKLHIDRCPWFVIFPALHPASTRSESTSSPARVSPSHGETRRLICQNVWNNLWRILWATVFPLIGTHPRVLLVNQLQSREEKWYRVSTVFLLTCQRTEIATSARRPR